MSGAISVWSCQRWRAVRSSADWARLLGFRVKSTGALRFSHNGRWQWNEGGRRRGKIWNQAQKNPIQNPRTSPRSIWEHRKRHRVRFCTAVVHVLPQTASVLHKKYAIYIAWQGRLPRFPAVHPRQSHPTSTSPLQIGAPSLLWSSEYCGGVNLHTLGTILLERASGWGIWTQPQWLHYSSVAWPAESLKQLSPDCCQPSPSASTDTERAREKKGREREQADWYDGMSETNILPLKKKKWIKPGSLGRGLVFDN